MFHHPLDGGEKVVHQLFRVDLGLKLAALVVIARITADRTQAVRGEGDEAGLGQPPGHIFDVRVEPAVFVHDHHCWYFAGGFGRTHQITANLAVALGRRVGDVLGNNLRIGEGDLLGQRIVGA
ncbi:hypothetical protein D3C78_1369120 [compost metagenome]